METISKPVTIITDFMNDDNWVVKTDDNYKDWNKLMTVVKKIRETAHCVLATDSQEKKNAFLIFSLNITTPIETVFMYVCNYINWYNLSKV